MDRDFSAEQPNRKWVSDITQIPTQEGDVYLAATMDLYSRMIVGWAMDEHMEASLTRRAFQMALDRRCPQGLPKGLLHHSDRGSQYSAGGFRNDLTNTSAVQSMSRKQNVWDNAAMESFFASLEKEVLADHTLPHVRMLERRSSNGWRLTTIAHGCTQLWAISAHTTLKPYTGMG